MNPPVPRRRGRQRRPRPVPTRHVLVLTTLPTTTDASVLARTLVEERLAACVSLYGEMESVYRWKGQVQREMERQVVMKTTEERVNALAARLRELHPYELPEFVVIPIVGGSDAYLGWVTESTS